MKSYSNLPLIRSFGLLMSVTVMSLVSVQAQQDFREFYQKAMATAQGGDLKQAAEIFKKCYIAHKPDLVLEDNGPQGGAAFFDYARILIAIRDFDEAKVWLTKAINAEARAKELQSPIKNVNPSANAARFQLGVVEGQLGNHQEALRLYQVYKDTKKPEAEWLRTRSNFFLSKGTSQIKLGKGSEGVATISELFQNRLDWQVRQPTLMQAILVLGEGWASQASAAGKDANKIKEIELQGHKFLDENLKYVSASPFDSFRLGYVDRFKKVGFDCASSNLYSLAIRFFSNVPTIGDIKNDLDLKLAQNNHLAPVPAAYQNFVNKIKAQELAPISPDLENYRVIATCYERMGNPTAAREIYRFLSQNYPDVPVERRAEILHEAARFSTVKGDTSSARYYSNLFDKEVPEDNPLRDNVSTFTIQSLVGARKFDEAIEVCEEVRGNYKLGDEKRELADAFYPISLLALKRYKEAEAPFDEYVKTYKSGSNRETVSFQRAMNSVSLRKFRNSAEQFDDFLKEYGESDRFKESVLVNLAVSRYSLQDYNAAIKATEMLEEFKPDSVEMARALITRGDSYMVSADQMGKDDKAKQSLFREKGIASYLAATPAAIRGSKKSPGNAAFFKEVAGQSIWNAFDYYNSSDNSEKALSKYDEFFPEYEGTQFEPQISVFALEVLEEKNRGEAGLKQVEKVINRIGELPPEQQDVDFLRKAIGSYSEASIRIRNEEQTIKIFDNFPNINKKNQALVTWLKMQQVIVLQELRNKEPKNGPKYNGYVKRIDGVFEEMAQFEKASLSSFALQQIGSNFSRSENPFTAVPYFEELLKRPENTFKGPAEFGIASIEMRNATKRAAAKTRFNRFINNYKQVNPDLVPEAHMNLAKIYIEDKEWKKASDQLTIINKNPTYFKSDKNKRAEAGVLWGNVLSALGDKRGAVKSYLAIANTYLGITEHSTEAIYQYAKVALEDIKKAPEVDDKGRAKRDREKQFFEVYLEYLYRWRELDPSKDSPSGALNSLRRSVDTFRSDLNISATDEEEIRFNLNIPNDWNPEI